MARIYSKQIAIGSVGAGAVVTVYTCPVGTTAVIRDICLVPLAAVPGVVWVTVNNSSYIYGSPGGTQYVTQQWTGRTVLVPGDTVEVGCPIGAHRFIISGYELAP